MTMPVEEDSQPAVNTVRCAGIFYGIALAVFILDQISKGVVTSFLHPGQAVEILGPVMSFHLRFNTGATWGMLSGATLWLTIITGVMVAVLLISGLFCARFDRLLRIALPVLTGGAAGNFADRVRIGAVVDFIDFHIWPVFNLADTAVVISAAMICYYLIAAELNREPQDDTP
ncbi:MAG: signal peptidase II [Armatimonadota bacterium]